MADAFRAARLTVEVTPLASPLKEARREALMTMPQIAAQVAAMVSFSMRFRRVVRSLGAEVVVTNTLKAHVLASISLVFSRTKLVFYIRDGLTTDFMSSAAVRLMQILVKHRAHGVIANSDWTMSTVPTTRQFRTVCPSPVLAPSGALHDASPRPVTFGILGRLSPWKGQDVVIRSFHKAFPDGPEVLEIAGAALFGEQEYEAELGRLVNDLKLLDRVRFLGHVSEPYETLATWDCMIHASTVPEPFGQVVVQGMASGLPVIATAAGGPAEVIQDGVTGILVPASDEVALARALRLVQEDADLRMKLGEAAANAATRYFPRSVVPELGRSLLGLRQSAGGS